jgi:N-acetylmuramoyl-L-alanine amidase
MKGSGLQGKLKTCSFLVSAFLGACVALAPLQARAGGPVAITEIRHWSYQDYTRVVIDLSGHVEFTNNVLKNPSRLYVDLKGGSLAESLEPEVKVKDGILRAIRASQFDQETVRIVLDLGDMDSFKVFSMEDPERVVIDVFGRSSRPRIRRVVVDAGHGGHDPGAIGPGGLKEKDVVLDVAREVKDLLEKEGYEVFLTRDHDEFLSLEERTVIANEKNADLFVSIHANANRKRDVKGIETYLLNWTDDEEALKVAARENAITVKRMQQARSELGVILASLELQNKRDESLKLAHYVQRSMVSSIDGRYGDIEDHGVKQALFYVLFGARMPSVLVEVSYITNYEEARRLKLKSYRRYLAHGITSGIDAYFGSALPPQSNLAQR